jgi:hypothetical protein
MSLEEFSTATKNTLVCDSTNPFGNNDAFTALAKAIVVRAGTSSRHFTPLAKIHAAMRAVDALTREGFDEYRATTVGQSGWHMLHEFCDFIQKNPRLPCEKVATLCSFLSSKAASMASQLLFVSTLKRKSDHSSASPTYVHKELLALDNREALGRLITPLLPWEYTGTTEDMDYITEFLSKVSSGVFENSGKRCHYGKAAHRAAYQNQKRRGGEAVTSATLNNEWAMFLIACLKVRVTIWHRDAAGKPEVLNNDSIIHILWRKELQNNPGHLYTYDQVVMCRPINGAEQGVLRAVRNNQAGYPVSTWPLSQWSRMYMKDVSLIPHVIYQIRVEAAPAVDCEKAQQTDAPVQVEPSQVEPSLEVIPETPPGTGDATPSQVEPSLEEIPETPSDTGDVDSLDFDYMPQAQPLSRDDDDEAQHMSWGDDDVD